MPELPEVELVSRSLDGLVRGRRIVSAELRRERLAPDTTPAEFAAAIGGTTVASVARRGKHILVGLENRNTLIVHLRMSGRFLLLEAGVDDPKFAHAAFYFEDGVRLVFDDQRHFGAMKIVKTAALESAKEIAKLAPEPFGEGFTPQYLFTSLKASKRSLKEFLLDQTKVCGLGNIYAAEAMFLAGIRPNTAASRISAARSARLYATIRGVLQEAIDAGSTLNTDPRQPEVGYYGGRYEDHWRVYDREGRPCPVCYTTIVRLKQAGRSSYYCPRCQKR